MLTQNETLFEAYAACPPSARIFCSPEIWQSSFAEPSPMLATIWAFEVAAPRAMVVVSDDCASGGLIDRYSRLRRTGAGLVQRMRAVWPNRINP